MTTEEALKIANAPMGGHLITVSHEALRVLADALRESQAQTVQMREDAALVADRLRADVSGGPTYAFLVAAARDIRALPAPAARTYDDGVRACLDAATESVSCMYGDEAKGARWVAEKIGAMLSPAPAVAPVENPHGCCKLDRCTMDANGVCDLAPVAAPNPGPTTYAQSECLRCGSRTPGMHDCKPPFDAEAALVAMEASIARRQYGATPATLYDVYTAIQDALAAGRGAR